MDFEIKGVHYNVSDHTREFITEKMEHIARFEDLIINLDFQITKDTHGFELASNVHFKWGVSAHLVETGIELFPLIDILMDKLVHKIGKEKEKITDHHH